jgi:UDP:flavonoid glycosyltransferase YjiC (YdhE family)
MRLLISSNPMFGHFTPLIPVARALQSRGHDVVVASEPAFAAPLRDHGFDHAPVGRDLSLDDVLSVLPEIFEVSAEEQNAYAFPRVFVELRARNVVDDLQAFVAEWKPDLILRENAEFASWAVAEGSALPHATVNVGAATSAHEVRALAGPWLRDLGLHLGIHDLDASSLYRYALLSFEPAGYNDWSDTPTASVFRLESTGATESLDPAIEALDDRPIIYATLGTEFYNAELMTTILAALSSDDWNVVATTGPQGDPANIDPNRSNMVVARWVPQDALLDRAALVVSHGGAGTITSALAHGVPVVVVPQGADQFHHAHRVEELGVGITLDAEHRSIDDLRTAVQTVLADPNYRNVGARLAAATARQPGVDVAAQLLEQLAETPSTTKI